MPAGNILVVDDDPTSFDCREVVGSTAGIVFLFIPSRTCDLILNLEDLSRSQTSTAKIRFFSGSMSGNGRHPSRWIVDGFQYFGIYDN